MSAPPLPARGAAPDPAHGPPVGRLFDRVLVPLDGSPLALGIVGVVTRLLRGTAAELTLLRVVGPRSAAQYDPMPGVELAMGRQLREVQERLSPGLTARLQLVRGDPAEEIVRCARESGHDLVAMSTHGRAGLERWLRGSVAEGVLRTCDLPLLLANPLGVEPRPDARLAEVLVPLDGSARSARALPLAVRVADAHAARVTTLHVDEAAGAHHPDGLTADTRRAQGDVVETILRHAEHADLLVMATHGRSGASRWWTGSVTEEVLHRARRPLLVVRTADPAG